MNIDNMTVQEIVDAIGNKELSTQAIADIKEVSNRTVQRKIKSLGYDWSQQDGKHVPTGAKFKEGNESLIFVSLFDTHAEAQNASDEVAVTKEVKAKGKPKYKAEFLSLYMGEEKPSAKVQRNYYMQEDVLSVIDTIPSLKRSEFVNECLRHFFKENGLL